MLKLGWLEVQNLVKGATILGTGGGFPPEKALLLYKKLFDEGRSLVLKDVSEFAETDLAFSAYGVGNIEETDLDVKKTVGLALEELRNFLRTDFKVIIPGEVGGEIGAFEIGSSLGIPVLDGDLVGGRAAPEIENDTFSVRDIPITPISVASEDGNTAIYTQATSTKKVEKFVRDFASLVGGSVFLAGYVTDIKTIKTTIGLGTLSKSIRIGETLAKALQDGLDPVSEVLKAVQGKQIFKGEIEKIEKQDREGFLSGYTYIKNNSSRLKIFFKNENLVAWLDGKPIITCPDLICILNAKTGEGIHNTKIKAGLEVVVIGIPSLPIWREKRGVELFGPKAFGFEIDYLPLEI